MADKFIESRNPIDCGILLLTIDTPFSDNKQKQKQIKKSFGAKLKNIFVNQFKHLFEFETNEISAVAVKFDNYQCLIPYCKQYCQALTEPKIYCKFESVLRTRMKVEIKIQTAQELQMVDI